MAFDKFRLNQLFYWMREREKVRQAKEAGKPKPWSKDSIFQGTRFCNVRRWDDKVSVWLATNWYPAGGDDTKQQLANAGMARLINWPASLQYFIDAGLNKTYNAVKCRRVMDHVIRAESKLFTGVYIINGVPGQPKTKTVLNQYSALYKNPQLVDRSSMQATHKNIQTLSGFGSFIAGQLVADLRHVLSGAWADRHTWAPLGPGSRRGMAWLQGWDGLTFLPSMRQAEFEELLTDLMKEGRKRVPKIVEDRQLEAHDFQNCLCEYDKFMRLTNATGKAKNAYPGLA